MRRCAVLASGGGTNFQALLDRRRCGDLHVEFVVLISNNSSAGACRRAGADGIPVQHLPPSGFADESSYCARLLEVLDEYRVELIVLAGYMKKIPVEVVRRYRNAMINIHPGLLPAFGGKGMYGMHVHEAVVDYGAKVTGITVHFVDEHYDHGPVILQEPVRVLEGDTAESLAGRVLEVEHSHYWRALEALAAGRLRVEGRTVTGNV